MKRPDASQYNPDPAYLRSLIERAGLTQRGAAKLIGINERAMRYYVSLNDGRYRASYPVQYALEALAENSDG